jgi:transcriptional regulator with XRE-family HTH domain
MENNSARNHLSNSFFMMKYHEMISRLKTTAAVLRRMLGLSVEDFGKLIGKSVSTVTKLETETLPLSEETAYRISVETGVSMDWLMVGNPREKPHYFDDENRKRPYKKELFERIQAQRNSEAVNLPDAGSSLIRAIVVAADFLSVYNAASESGKAEHIAYLVKQFTDDLVERFGKNDAPFLTLNADARIITREGEEWKFARKEDGQDGITLQRVVPPKRSVKK